ncbi:hypothetical protein [Methylobacterium persicinum]|uniref:Uncharacterized protein n=1 Tax=Methylobacterium persicinum TaxID=374426 RepID=A0ABU0HSE5_9HYPH|nr:hypothetical protein [Methylobacterium persicinum]MDQ0445248.1 hypothetical protein [Methylobacterium persicinum]GJE37872.1 hypothetical protein KHHGKMAE_1934 [Methylobacterium persicinum]
MSDNGKCIFWAPEGPMLRVSFSEYKGFTLHIMDLNPEQHTRWALSRGELLRIGWGLIRSAFRRAA